MCVYQLLERDKNQILFTFAYWKYTNLIYIRAFDFKYKNDIIVITTGISTARNSYCFFLFLPIAFDSRMCFLVYVDFILSFELNEMRWKRNVQNAVSNKNWIKTKSTCLSIFAHYLWLCLLLQIIPSHYLNFNFVI